MPVAAGAQARARLKTDFRISRQLEPVYTGGNVAATSDGAWLFATVGDDVLVTDVRTGAAIDRYSGDANVITMVATPTPHDAAEATGVLLVARRSLTIALHAFPAPAGARPLRIIARAHEAPILVSAADASGSLFATGAADGSVKVWDARQGHMTHVFRGHAAVLTALAFDVDAAGTGRARLASASEDGQVRVWDLHTRAATHVLRGHNSAVTALAFTADAIRLVSAGRDAVVLVWDVAGANVSAKGAAPKGAMGRSEPLLTVPVFEIVEAAGVVSVGKRARVDSKGKQRADATRQVIYTAGSRGVVRLWDLESGEPVGTHAAPAGVAPEITDVLLLSSCKQLLVVRNDHIVSFRPIGSLLKPRATSSRHVIGYNDEVIDTVFLAPDDAERERLLAVATNSALIRLYGLDSDGAFDRTQLLDGHSDVVLALARSEHGAMLLSGGKDRTARLWAPSAAADAAQNPAPWHCVAVLAGHLEAVGAVALADDYAATASADHTLKLWSLDGLGADQPRLASLSTTRIHDKDINSLAVAPGGRMLASGSQDRTARLFSVGAGGASLAPIGTLTGHKRGVWCVRFAPVDRLVATASGDRTVKLWSTADLACLKTFEGHTNSVLRVDFIAQGQQLVTCASDGLVKLWNVRDEDCVATLDNHEDKIWALAVSRDEATVVSGAADGVVTLWADATAEVAAAKAAEAEDLVLRNQDYENFVVARDFRSAFLLALSLDQPRRLYGLFSGLLASSDRQAGSLTGHGAIDDAIAALEPAMVVRLLGAVRDWNAVARTADAAQAVLHAVLKLHAPDALLNAGLADGDLLDGLLPYTERHYARADRLLGQESYALDFLLAQCDVLDDEDDVMDGVVGAREVAGR